MSFHRRFSPQVQAIALPSSVQLFVYLLVCSFARLGAPFGHTLGTLGHPWAALGSLGHPLGSLEHCLGAFGHNLGTLWAPFGTLWAPTPWKPLLPSCKPVSKKIPQITFFRHFFDLFSRRVYMQSDHACAVQTHIWTLFLTPFSRPQKGLGSFSTRGLSPTFPPRCER